MTIQNSTPLYGAILTHVYSFLTSPQTQAVQRVSKEWQRQSQNLLNRSVTVDISFRAHEPEEALDPSIEIISTPLVADRGEGVGALERIRAKLHPFIINALGGVAAVRQIPVYFLPLPPPPPDPGPESDIHERVAALMRKEEKDQTVWENYPTSYLLQAFAKLDHQNLLPPVIIASINGRPTVHYTFVFFHEPRYLACCFANRSVAVLNEVLQRRDVDHPMWQPHGCWAARGGGPVENDSEWGFIRREEDLQRLRSLIVDRQELVWNPDHKNERLQNHRFAISSPTAGCFSRLHAKIKQCFHYIAYKSELKFRITF